MRSIYSHVLFGISITLLLLTSSCQTDSKPEKYAAVLNDFPNGWVFYGEDWDDIFGGDGYSVAYGTPNSNTNSKVHTVDKIGFGQTISVYSDQNKTQSAFLEWKEEWFDDTVQKWPGAEFTPLDPNDEYIYECQQILIDKSIVSCVFLQRHNQIVTMIIMTLDGKAITLSQFNEVLIVLDKRLNKVNLD